MYIYILLLIIGFLVLIKGADIFVDGASSIATHLKLSKMLIGLTVVSFGTSAPEFAVSVQSHLNGSSQLLIGNVIGSNIVNILLIISIAAIIRPIKIKNATVKKELPILMLTTTLLVVLLLDAIFDIGTTNLLTRSDGIIIVLFFLVFIYYLISVLRNKKSPEQETAKYPIVKSIVFTVLGIILVIIGSDLVVQEATNIASTLGVSERIIALTIVALGTSLPELVTSIVSALKNEQDILVGNIIGSNIFNICVVLGVPIALFGGISAIGFSYVDLSILLISTIILFAMSAQKYKLGRKEGIFMLMIFIIYYSFIITEGVV